MTYILFHTFINKLINILVTAQGIVMAFLLFLFNACVNYIVGFEMDLTIITIAVATDAVWGIARSLKAKKFATSELARETLSKLLVYATLMLVFIGIDKVLNWEKNWSCDMICAMICLVELYSIIGNILIVYPKFPILCLLRRFVIGEIANKLDIKEEDVEAYLKGKIR